MSKVLDFNIEKIKLLCKAKPFYTITFEGEFCILLDKDNNLFIPIWESAHMAINFKKKHPAFCDTKLIEIKPNNYLSYFYGEEDIYLKFFTKNAVNQIQVYPHEIYNSI